MTKLSIITICYNDPNLSKTCESIINQSWQDFEWIVIDGGSNKDTLQIFEKYKNRINKFISEPDKGRYNAMNKGIKLASGEYLNFLNAGDWYFYNDVLNDIFSKNQESDILYGHEVFVYKDCSQNKIEYMPEIINKDFLLKSTIRHQAAFIKKELFKKYGFYNETLQIAADFEKWLEFYHHKASFVRLAYIITNYDSYGISFNKKSKVLAIKERKTVLKKFFSSSEIKDMERKIKKNYSFAEQIFSIKNASDSLHKIITILGLHIKIKRSIQ